MSTRLTSLRDFLLLFFFIVLGANLDLARLGSDLSAALVLAAFVLIGNPVIVMIIMGAMGYRKRTGFLAGLTVAQISEFSLIFIAMGVTLGHVDERAVGLVTLVGLVTIAASVYMIMFSHPLYEWLAPALRVFERRIPIRETVESPSSSSTTYDVVVFGLGRYGGAILQLLKPRGLQPLGVDFSPSVVRGWRAEGIDTLYGDITDPEFLGFLPLQNVSLVVSATPEHDLGIAGTDPRVSLTAELRRNGYRGRIAAAAYHESAAERLRTAGVDLVLVPFRDAAERAVELLLGNQRDREVELIEVEKQKELIS